MRQRRIKNLDKKLAMCADYIIYEPEANRGRWREVFREKKCKDIQTASEDLLYKNEKRKLCAELGCGKGSFIIGLGATNPDTDYLGIEVQQSVISVAGRKLLEKEPNNILLINKFVSDIEEIFGEGELDGLYLNFSDPWPKKKHAKRRLTHRNKLLQYRRAISPGGFLEFKSDNDGLYEFTVEELRALDYNISDLSEDLHNSEYMDGNIMTEYEEKFSNRGKNIYYIRVEF